VLGWPFVATGRRPRWWSDRRVRVGVTVAALVAAEVWQLLRFGVVTF